ncbi:hypothetical protein PR048_021175 [Dryococelus australis]|uniref:Uncharacterized protein n=1 Tax=Dryococelus australis TaxID=614101 RepID=A0ABQ9GXK1_9NEOP|nr:hypothetical protein PR048_021175 [Dryococelus australis]
MPSATSELEVHRIDGIGGANPRPPPPPDHKSATLPLSYDGRATSSFALGLLLTGMGLVWGHIKEIEKHSLGAATGNHAAQLPAEQSTGVKLETFRLSEHFKGSRYFFWVGGGTVAERLARSPPTKANRALIPGRVTGFSQACGFSRGSPVSPAHSFRRRSIFIKITLIGSQDVCIFRRGIFFLLELPPRETRQANNRPLLPSYTRSKTEKSPLLETDRLGISHFAELGDGKRDNVRVRVRARALGEDVVRWLRKVGGRRRGQKRGRTTKVSGFPICSLEVEAISRLRAESGAFRKSLTSPFRRPRGPTEVKGKERVSAVLLNIPVCGPIRRGTTPGFHALYAHSHKTLGPALPRDCATPLLRQRAHARQQDDQRYLVGVSSTPYITNSEGAG